MKIMVFLTLFAFIISLSYIPGPVIAPEEYGCCANIDLPSGYCISDVFTQSECCPEDSENYGLAGYPQDINDCKVSYWKSGTCNDLLKCELGCCYDPTSPSSRQCIAPQTKDLCLAQDGAKFAYSRTGSSFGGSLCYVSQSDGTIAKIFGECPDKTATTLNCSHFNGNKASCLGTSLCSFCPSTGQCLSDCSSCQQASDSNKDGECDGSVQIICSQQVGEQFCKSAGCKYCQSNNNCENNCNLCPGNQYDGNGDDKCDNIREMLFCSEMNSQQECAQSSLNCRWCQDTIAAASKCRPFSYGCQNCQQSQDANNDKVCDSAGLAQCNDNIDNDADGAVDSADFCCDNPNDNAENNQCQCPASKQCVAYGIQQCFDGNGSRVSTRLYNSPGETHICCSQDCFMPLCPEDDVVGSFDKTAITTLAGAPYAQDYCKCGNDVVNSKLDNRFCCKYNDGMHLQNSPCQTVVVAGKIIDKSNSLSLPGHIKFFNRALRLNFELDTNIIREERPGLWVREYRIIIPHGEVFDVEAQSAGYEALVKEKVIDTSSAAPNSEFRIDFELDRVSQDCRTSFPKPVLNARTNECSQVLSISWEPYACLVSKYYLYRSETSGSEGAEIAVLGPNVYDYEDTSAMAGKTYYYLLKVEPASIPAQVESDAVSIYSGDAICLNQCIKKKFCLENSNGGKTLIGSCDETNKLNTYDCQAAYGEGAICMDQREDGILKDSICKTRDNCKDIDIALDEVMLFPNIFGMLYSIDPTAKKCLGQEQRNYCYLDVYDALGTDSETAPPANPFSTTADRCISCNSEMACFDYKSKEACRLDNCIAGGETGCIWEESIPNYAELGRGLCYKPGDASTGRCSECESNCDDSYCSKLGACYASPDYLQCKQCKLPSAAELAPTACEDYTSIASCIGDAEFDIPGGGISVAEFVKSMDHCGLGVCKWAANRCYKDGDDNDVPDCNNNVLCQRDTLPPVSTLQAPPFLSTATPKQAAFYINDVTYGNVNSIQLYFCADTKNKCSPNIARVVSKNSQGNFVLTVELPIFEKTDSKYYVRYFAVDAYSNVEPLKVKQLEIDTIMPEITINSPIITPNLQDTTKSDVSLVVGTSEHTICGIEFFQLGLASALLHGYPKHGIALEENYTITHQQLADGVYQLRVNCTDYMLNSRVEQKTFVIDTNRQITSIRPFDEIVASRPVVLEIKTLNDQFGKSYYSCYYKWGESTPQPFGIPINPNAPIGEDFIYRAQLNLADGFHAIDAECRDNGIVIDTASTVFSVDTAPPEVYVYYESQDGYEEFDPSQTYISSTIIRFGCNDDLAEFNNLGPYGCLPSDIKYCFGTAYSACSIKSSGSGNNFDPNNPPKLNFSGYLCFAATDGHNNNFNSLSCVLAKVDNDAPQLFDLRVNGESYSPFGFSPLFVVKEPLIKISGKWRDSSGYVKIMLDNEEKIYEAAGEGYFLFSPVELVENSENLFSLGAMDMGAVNGHNAMAPITLRVAHDNIGPLITQARVLNQLQSQIQVPSLASIMDTAGSEYASIINLSAKITDPRFTYAVSSATADIKIADNSYYSTGCKTSLKLPLKKLENDIYSAVIKGCLEVGNYSITYTAEDSLENIQSSKSYFRVKDSIAPKMNITVYEEGTDNNVSHMVAGADGIRRYDVVVNADDSLHSVSEFYLAFNNIIGEQVKVPVFLEKQDGKLWKGKLIVVRGGVWTRLDNIQGTFSIKAYDLNHVETSQIQNGNSIFIDTFGPRDPPVFYRLTSQPASQIYTSQKEFLVSGHEFNNAPNSGITLKHSLDDSSESLANALIYPLTSVKTPNILREFMSPTGKSLLDERIISISGSQMRVFDPLDRFGAIGHYFAFNSPMRATGENYQISGIRPFSSSGDLKTIAFSPAFEGDIAEISDPILVMDTPSSAGWFGVTVPLELGPNYFTVSASDIHGNPGRESGVYMIVFENRKPEFYNELPRDGSVISDNMTVISISILNHTPIAQSSMRIGDGVVFAPQLETKNGITRMLYVPNNALQEGAYSVKVNTTDAAGNSNEYEWLFTVRIGVPLAPLVRPSGFINSSKPEIMLEFARNETVNVTNLTITAGSGFYLDITKKLRPYAYSSFAYTLEAPLADDAYYINAEASKLLSRIGAVLAYSNKGFYPGNQFVVDSVLPEINVSSPKAVNQNYTYIAVNVSDKNFLAANITGGDLAPVQSRPVLLSDKTGMLSADDILVNISANEEGAKSILVTAFDKAGNKKTGIASVIFDKTAPSLNVVVNSPALLNGRFTNETKFDVKCECKDTLSACGSSSMQLQMKIGDGMFTQLADLSMIDKTTNITFMCSAYDYAGNLGVSERNITIIREGPLIELIKPRYSGTYERYTPIEIRTDMPSYCTLHSFRDGAPIAAFQPLSSGRTMHIASMDLGPNYRTGPKTVAYYIKCRNDYSHSTIVQHELLVDVRLLNITRAWLSKGAMVNDNLKNIIQLETSLDSQCRFAFSDIASPPYIPVEALPYIISDSFSKEHSVEFDFGANGLFHLYIGCFDRTEKVASNSGWMLSFEIDVDMPIQIEEEGIFTVSEKATIKKEGAYLTRDTMPVLFVKTNKKSVFGNEEGCMFKRSIWPSQPSTNVEAIIENRYLFHRYSLPVDSPLNDDNYEYEVLCQSGLDEASSHIKFTVDTVPPGKPELQAPEGSVISDGQIIANKNIAILGKADKGTKKVDIQFNGNYVRTIDNIAGTFDIIVDSSMFSHNNVVTITAAATDALGNGPGQAGSIVVLFDKLSEKPSIAELPFYTNTGIAEIKGASEPGSMVRVYAGSTSESAVLIYEGRAGDNGEFSFEVSGFGLGRNIVYARAVDVIGNRESEPSEIKTITYDTTGPILIYRYPEKNDLIAEQAVNIRLLINDVNSPLDEETLSVKVDGKDIPFSAQHTESLSVTAYHQFDKRGSHNISVEIKDTAGNIMHSGEWNFIVNYPPQCEDSVDNDNDGKTDFGEDLGCCGRDDDNETDYSNHDTQCSDSVDNDADGKIDYCFGMGICDKHCSCLSDNYEGPITTECNDGIDNDNDGLIDFCDSCDKGCDNADDNNETDYVAAPKLLKFTFQNKPAQNENYVSSSDAVIGFSFDKKVKIEEMLVDNAPVPDTSLTSDSMNYVYEAKGLAEQQHTFTVRASTTGGETIRSVSFIVDATKPLITIANQDTTLNSRNGVEIFGTFEESYLDYIYIQRKLNSNEIIANTFKTMVDMPAGNIVEAVIRDRAGNEAKHSIKFEINTAPPKLIVGELPAQARALPVIISGQTIPSSEVSVKINDKSSIVQSDGSGRFRLEAGLNEGIEDQFVNTINISVMNQFESSSEVISKVLFDSQPPKISVKSPDNGEQGNFSELIVEFEDISGIDYSSVEIFGNGEPLEHKIVDNVIKVSLSGIYKGIPVPMNIILKAKDALGNLIQGSWSFTMNSGPVIEFIYPLDKFVKSAIPFIKVKVTGFDPGSVGAVLLDKDGIQLRLFAVAGPGGEFTFYPLEELKHGSSYTLEVRAVRGRISESIARKEIIVDAMKPVLALERPASPTNADTITLKGSFVESNPAVLFYEINGIHEEIPFQKTGYGGSFEKKDVPLGSSDQEITIRLGIEDKAGNANIASYPVIVDRTKPNVAILQPSYSMASSRIIELAAEADGDSRITIYLNDIIVESNIKYKKGEELKRSAVLSSGANALVVEAADAAGNSGYDDVEVFYDDIAPLIANVKPRNPVNTKSPVVSAVIDDNKGIEKYSVFIDGKRAFGESLEHKPSHYEISQKLSFELSDNNYHTVQVEAADINGNIARSETVRFLVGLSLPSIIWSSPADGSITSIASPLIQVEYDEIVDLMQSALDNSNIIFTTKNNRLFEYQASSLSDSPHLVSLTASKPSKAAAESALGFTVDTKIPSLRIDGLSGYPGEEPLINTYNAALKFSYSDEHMKKLKVSGAGNYIEENIIDREGIEEEYNKKAGLSFNDGLNIITVEAEDRAGNINSSQIKVHVDTVGASVESVKVAGSLALAPSIFRTSSSIVDISGSYSENPVNKIKITSPAAGSSEALLEPLSRAFLFKGVALITQPGKEVINEFTIIVEDGAGNIKTKNITIISDQSGPLITMLEPVANASVNRRPLIRIRLNEAASQCSLRYMPGSSAKVEQFVPIDGITYEITPSFKLSIGKNNIEMSCIDSLGNIGSPLTAIIYIEKELPEGIPVIASVMPDEGILLEQNNYLVYNVNSQNQGVFRLQIVANDDSDGVRCLAGREIDYLNYKTLGYESLNFSAVHMTEMITAPAGIRSFYVQCIDRVGKKSGIYEVNVTIDPNYPVIIKQLSPVKAYLNNTDGDYNEVIAVSTMSMDAECRIDYIGRGVRQPRMVPSFDGVSYIHKINTVDTDASLLEDGSSYTFEVICEDKLGNLQASTKTIYFTADYSISQPVIIRPENDTTIHSSIAVSGFAEKGSSVSLYINDNFIASLLDAEEFLFADAPLRLGSNLIKIVAVDKAGNSASSTKGIYYSSQGPSLRITSPEEGKLLPELASVEGIISSDIGVNLTQSYIEVRGPDGAVAPARKSTDYSRGKLTVWFEPAIAAEGRYGIDIVGYDTKGRTSRNTSYIIIDRNVPLVAILEPEEGTVASSPVFVSGMIKSTVPVEQYAYVGANKVSVAPKLLSSTMSIYVFNYTGLALNEGLNTFNATVTNIFGITGSEARSVTLDTTGPDAIIIIE